MMAARRHYASPSTRQLVLICMAQEWLSDNAVPGWALSWVRSK